MKTAYCEPKLKSHASIGGLKQASYGFWSSPSGDDPRSETPATTRKPFTPQTTGQNTFTPQTTGRNVFTPQTTGRNVFKKP
jgi:hypothetical protein